MGWRGGGRGRSGPWPGRGPFSYLPPWQRPGWLFGYGRGLGYGYGGVGYGRGLGYGVGFGYGYGRGLGYGYGGAPYNPWVCQRFPWLPRWWWAQPGAYGYDTPYTGYGYGTPYTGYGYGTPYTGYGYPRWPYQSYAAPYPRY